MHFTRDAPYGVQVHNSLEVATQVDGVVKKAYGIDAFNSWSIEYKSWEVKL